MTPAAPCLLLWMVTTNNECCGCAHVATNERKLARPWEHCRCSQPSQRDEWLLPSHVLTSPMVRPTFSGSQHVSNQLAPCTALNQLSLILSAHAH